MPDSQNPQLPIPYRLRDLDPRTIELLARLNEEERQSLIEFAGMGELERDHLILLLRDMDNKKIKRLHQFLGLADEKWEAGFDIVSNRVFFWKVFKNIPVFVLGLVGFLTALAKLWEWIAPYIRIGGK